MPRPLRPLLLAVIALCLGLQPVTWAMDAARSHGGASAVAVHTGTADPKRASVQDPAPPPHEECHRTEALDAPIVDAGGCDCRLGCAMPGCAGNVPSIAAPPEASDVGPARGAFLRIEPRGGPRAAHAFELIRPPSTS